jgi:cytochrome P450
VVGGYRIPAGTSVLVDAYALNIRNPFWSVDGSEFRPERWENLKLGETRYNMWRFGFGPRNCMGRILAEKILRITLIELIKDYEFSVCRKGSEDPEGDQESWITHPDVRIAFRQRKK